MRLWQITPQFLWLIYNLINEVLQYSCQRVTQSLIPVPGKRQWCHVLHIWWHLQTVSQDIIKQCDILFERNSGLINWAAGGISTLSDQTDTDYCELMPSPCRVSEHWCQCQEIDIGWWQEDLRALPTQVSSLQSPNTGMSLGRNPSHFSPISAFSGLI